MTRRAALVFTVAVAGCKGQPAPGDAGRETGRPEPSAPVDDRAQLGKQVYTQKCVICHGEKGDGKGEVADLLYPPPRDFTLGVFKFRSTPAGTLPLDQDLIRTVSEGMHGSSMLPFKEELSNEERSTVVSYVKTFSQRWKAERSGSPVSLGSPLPKIGELLALGQRVYKKSECARCHGATGKGDGPEAKWLKDLKGRPIVVRDLTNPGNLRGGHTPSDIVRTVLTGLDGTPMVSYAEEIKNARERWGLAYFIESLSKGRSPPEMVGNRVIAERRRGELPLDPLAHLWRSVRTVQIPLQHLRSGKGRKPIERIDVRAVHNERHLAVMVEWPDAVLNRRKGIHDFSDAVAVEFPISHGVGGRPFHAMGDHKRPVDVWYWRADPKVENLNASAPGTLTSLPRASQHPEGKGLWVAGRWRVVFRRALRGTVPGQVELRVGQRYPIAFAVWDGAALERNGNKAFSAWQTLEIQGPSPPSNPGLPRQQ